MLSTGTTLGPYEIESRIGAGGMGVVYRARDTRLGRDVAVKVLSESFAADRERLRRFEQEARAIAALSHPNILAVYDVGQENGTHYLVSELLEGETLREMLARGALSHRKAVGYAIQTAHALAAAHSKNIAHRDLKPDNVFITHDGQVKILDFGLAKSVLPVSHNGTESDATMTMAEASPGPETDAGTVMGTAGYMSPEQVRGKAVDCRTDIFSFGAVLYEMLTGVRAFKRDTAAETMTAILNEEPPDTFATGKHVPPALDRIIRHCLEKSPEQRFQSARDLAFDLEASGDLTSSGGLPAAKARSRVRWWYWALGAAVVLAAALGGWKLSDSSHVSGIQFHQLTYRRGVLADARFTPDGQSVLFTASWEGEDPEIDTAAASGSGGHSIGISNARLLAVSKTGEIAVSLAPKRVAALWYPGTLARTTNGAGAPKPEIENIEAADYAPDGSALAIVRLLPDKQICQVEYPIGKVLYSSPAIGDIRFSPNGRYLALVEHEDPRDDRGDVVILKTDGEKVAVSPLHESLQGLAWTPSGNEVWFTSPLESGAIGAMSLSGKTREVLSVPGRLFLRDISANGQLLAEQGIVHIGNFVSTGNGAMLRDLSWLDFGYLRGISDDGKMILFEEEGAENPNSEYRIFVRDSDGSAAIPVGEGYGVALSHDKQWALGLRVTTTKIWLYPVGAGEPRPISTLDATVAGGFLPGDKAVFYVAREPGHPYRTWLQDLNGGGPRPITAEGVVGVRLSPDGKWFIAGPAPDLFQRLTMLAPISGGALVPISGLKQDEYPIGWTSDNRLYVAVKPLQTGVAALSIVKLDPRTGARTPWRDVPIPRIGGLATIAAPFITPDGSSYAWGYQIQLNDIYTISVAH